LSCSAANTTTGILGYSDLGDVFKISADAGALSIQVDVIPGWSGNSRANLDVMVALVGNSTGTPAVVANATRSTAAASPAIVATLEATLVYTITAPGT
jgi:hypothetical protein